MSVLKEFEARCRATPGYRHSPEAIAFLKSAREGSVPPNQKLWITRTLGRALLMAGSPEEAFVCLREVLSARLSEVARAAVLGELSTALVSMGDLLSARDAALQALLLEPGHEVVRNNLLAIAERDPSAVPWSEALLHSKTLPDVAFRGIPKEGLDLIGVATARRFDEADVPGYREPLDLPQAIGRGDAPWLRPGRLLPVPLKVAHIRDGAIFRRGRGVFVLDGKSELLEDYSFGLACPMPRDAATRRIPGRAFVIADRFAGDNYCHWLLDWLPRIDAYRRAGYEPARVIHNGNRLDYHASAAARLHLSLNDECSLRDGAILRADELVVLSSTGRGHQHPAQCVQPEVLDFLRRTFGGGVPSAGDRLYVSRADAAGRRVADEARLIEELENRGFRAVTLSGMPVGAQAAVFSNARVVVGPHGAGLTNIVFTGPGTTLVELFSGEYGTPAFWKVAQRSDMIYRYFVGESVAKGHRSNMVNADIVLDVAEFLRFLDDVLAE